VYKPLTYLMPSWFTQPIIKLIS